MSGAGTTAGTGAAPPAAAPTRDFLPPPGIGFLALFEDGELRRKLDEGLTRDLEPRDMVERLYVTDVAHCVWEAARARSAATEILNTEITRQSFEAYFGGQCVGEERRRGPLSDSDRLGSGLIWPSS